MITWKE